MAYGTYSYGSAAYGGAAGSYLIPALTLSLKSPSCSIAYNHVVQRLTMLVKQPTNVRYIYNPVVTGGCPQCGTYLYYKEPDSNNPAGARRVRSKAVRGGRNYDRGRLDDRKYVKCARCGFVCHKERDNFAPRGSKIGWGMKYEEVDARDY